MEKYRFYYGRPVLRGVGIGLLLGLTIVLVVIAVGARYRYSVERDPIGFSVDDAMFRCRAGRALSTADEQEFKDACVTLWKIVKEKT